MKWAKHIHLTDSLIENLKKHSTVKTFTLKTPLFYEGQIPIVAYLVLKGSIQLSRKKKIYNTLRPGALLGIEEVIDKNPADLTAEVLGNTTLCFIDRSTLLEIRSGNNSLIDEFLAREEKEA